MTKKSESNLSQSLSGGWETVNGSEKQGMIAEINRNQPPFVAWGHVPRRNDNQAIRRISQVGVHISGGTRGLASIQANDTRESGEKHFLKQFRTVAFVISYSTIQRRKRVAVICATARTVTWRSAQPIKSSSLTLLFTVLPSGCNTLPISTTSINDKPADT